MGSGREGGLMIILEAPGSREVGRKSPCTGTARDIVDSCLAQASYRGPVWFTNTVLCHPPASEKPAKAAVDACSDRLREEIIRVRPNRILLCGATSIALMGWKNVSDSRGAVSTYSYVDHKGQGREALVASTWHPAAILRDPDLFRDFAHDINKLIETQILEDEPKVEVIIPSTKAEALEALYRLDGASALSCDIETTGFSVDSDDLLSIAFGALCSDNSGVSVVIPRELLGDEDIREYMRLVLSSSFFDQTIVFHNIKFDIQFLRRYFEDPYLKPRKPGDTLMMAYALDERGSVDTGGRSYRVRGLKYLARVYYNAPEYALDLEWFLGQPDEERDYPLLYRYQAFDCYWTIRLYFDMKKRLEEESPKLVKLVDELLVPGSLAFAKAEQYGIMVDVPYLHNFREELIEETATMRDRLGDLSGMDDFNPRSHVQVKKALSHWKFSPPSTDRQDYLLEARNEKYPQECKDFVHTLLDFRQKDRVLGTYVEGMLKRVEKGDRIHADFLLHGTDTGRLSARNPNLQNIPVLMGKQVRNIFISPPGYKMVNADYSQLELRVAAFYSRDEEMMEAFHRNMDIHTWVAALMFKKPMEEITKYERYLAKYLDFGVLYGRGAVGITQGWEAEHMYELTGKRWTLDEAQQLSDDFFNAFPGLRDYISSQHRTVLKQQYIETPTGRRRRFPYIDKHTAGNVKRRSVNSPIQGFASDMALTSVIRLTDIFRDRAWDAHIVSSVHDSIMFEVSDNILDEVLPVIKETMETPCIDYFDVPLRVDLGVGTKWGEMDDA